MAKLISAQILRDRTMKQLQQFYQKPIAKVSAELLVTILAVTLLALFAIGPTLNTMSQLLKDIEDRKKTSEELTKKIAALSTLSGEFPIIRQETTLLEAAIPNTADFDGFARRIEKIAAEHRVLIVGMQVATIPPEQVSARKEATTFAVTISFRAPYEQVRPVLDDLLRMDRFVTIESMAMSNKRDEIAKTSILTTNVVLRVAYYGTATVDPKAKSNAPAKKEEPAL
jgi:Tfp pilus assembly protein PilO